MYIPPRKVLGHQQVERLLRRNMIFRSKFTTVVASTNSSYFTVDLKRSRLLTIFQGIRLFLFPTKTPLTGVAISRSP